MSTRSTVMTVLQAYAHDLQALIDNAGAQIERGTAHTGLMAKVCMETARLAAYERLFLHPTLSALPDGAEHVRLAGERLETLLGAAREVETAPADESAMQPLQGLARAVHDLAADQHDRLFPLVERAAPADVLENLGARVAGTQQAGATHSHPTAIEQLDATGWPSPGYTDTAYDAFVEEVRTREPGISATT
jgi:hypothetical protein